MLTLEQEGSPLIEINGRDDIQAVAFAANGEYIVGGGHEVGVWRMEDGKQMATLAMPWSAVYCLAVSKNGRWIPAGTFNKIIVWGTKTCESHREGLIYGVDFSPDSTRLVTASHNRTATVFGVRVATRNLKKVHTRPRALGDSGEILAARRPDRDSHS